TRTDAMEMSETGVSRRAVLAAGVLLAAGGCARRPHRGPTAELVWLTGGISTADQSPAEDIAKRWNTQHPLGPAVRVEPLPQTADEQRQVLALELNAGLRNFDIFDLDVVWTAEFAQHGWLADLQDLRPDIEPLSLRESMRSAEWDGTLWAAPYAADMGILYYRSDLVDKPPVTWDELIVVGRRVGEQNGIAPFVADGKQYEGLVVQYLEYLWGRGGEVFGQNGHVLAGEAAVKAAEFMRDAFREGVYAPGFNTMDVEEARKTFQSGDAAFMRSWPYAYQPMNATDPTSLVTGKVGIAPLPAFPGHQPVSALGGHHLAVSPFSRDIAAAKDFVKFVATSRDVQLGLAQRHSRPPTLASAYDDLADDRMMRLLKKVLPTVKARPVTPDWNTISIEMQQQIFAAYTGETEPKAAVRTLQDFLGATAMGG
ncbi:MAG TPA: ABC transporter substrate-binding protein, partial [Pseudonocardiaceae bacterium]|nr:ABC transporter substrate-binding protein [Pseudonocardiaceae bacterium]